MAAHAGRIDVHFHLVPPFYREAVEAAGAGPARGAFPDWTPEASLALMDRFDIDFCLPSVTYPGVQFMDPVSAQALARRCNEYSSWLMRQAPDRFGAFSLVPMHEPDRAIAEIAYALDTLGHDGVCLFSSYGNRFLGDAAFDPVMAELDRRQAVVFIHPTFSPPSQAVGLFPGFAIEYPFDTTRAAANLIFSRSLERFPRIRFILSHAGGTLPFLAWRLSVSPLIAPKALPMAPADVLAGVRHFWFDTALSPGRTAMAALDEFAAPERVLFGSDWPYANADVVDMAVRSYEQPGLVSDRQRAAIDRGNALALFPRLGV
jgi:predicted TIM-barrel fold metal-dependent hydrolase